MDHKSGLNYPHRLLISFVLAAMAEEVATQTDVKLPLDLLHLVCTELASRADFGTLFNCAVSSKHFANAGALANLYRYISSTYSPFSLINIHH